MSWCRVCGGNTSTSMYNKLTGQYEPICDECAEKEHLAEIEVQGDKVERCSDFKTWDHGDFSDLFWLHLGRYVKCPNKHSLRIMSSALMWACHADHGLSTNFYNALKWCKLDLWHERKRTDLPDEYHESEE